MWPHTLEQVRVSLSLSLSLCLLLRLADSVSTAHTRLTFKLDRPSFVNLILINLVLMWKYIDALVEVTKD